MPRSTSQFPHCAYFRSIDRQTEYEKLYGGMLRRGILCDIPQPANKSGLVPEW